MSESFTVTREWMMMLRSLPTDRAFVNVVSALADYAMDGKDADGLSEDEKRIFAIIKQKIKNRKCKANYLHKKRHENSTVESTVEQPLFDLDNSTVESTVEPKKDRNSATSNQYIDTLNTPSNKSKIYYQSPNGGKKPKKQTLKIPPTLEEVREYCKFRRNAVDPEEFYSRYQMVDWMVGNHKMKDWQAAIRYWERSMYNRRKKLSQTRDYSGI